MDGVAVASASDLRQKYPTDFTAYPKDATILETGSSREDRLIGEVGGQLVCRLGRPERMPIGMRS